MLQKIDNLIQYKKTGSPADLAQRFKVSEKCIRNHINVLRGLGAPIAFCRRRKSYFYKAEGYFYFKFIQNSELE